MSETKEIDFGPLKNLIGNWQGDKGIDIAPKTDGSTEENPFYETISFTVVGDLKNAKKQTLAVLRYYQVVNRKSNGEVFHDETGYWMWDAETNIVMQSLTIPRAVCVLAGGTYKKDTSKEKTIINVSAGIDDKDWQIIQSPFMKENAKTTGFKHTISVEGNSLIYEETTILDIYGKEFIHTDKNELKRV